MSLNIQTNLAIPQSQMTFRAKKPKLPKGKIDASLGSVNGSGKNKFFEKFLLAGMKKEKPYAPDFGITEEVFKNSCRRSAIDGFGTRKRFCRGCSKK